MAAYQIPHGERACLGSRGAERPPTQPRGVYNRPDFWVPPSNKQLNFVQHVKSLLAIHGRAAVVLPDDEEGLVLRPPDQPSRHARDQADEARGPGRLRRPLHPGNRQNREQTWSEIRNPEGRWRAFTYEEITARDKCSLDLFWIRDESLEDAANPPGAEPAHDLRAALGRIEGILGDLEARAARRDIFPRRHLQPAVDEGPIIGFGGLAPLRVWCLSEDESRLLQLQQDRIYLNWRARGGQYPRFSNHGDRPGLLREALTEWDRFRGHVHERHGFDLTLDSIELAKVDDLIEGIHWDGFVDLGVMLPITKTFEVRRTERAQMGVQMNDERDDGRLLVTVGTGATASPDGQPQRFIRLNCRRSVDVAGTADLEKLFTGANDEANDVFGSLISAEQRRIRFGIQEGV